MQVKTQRRTAISSWNYHAIAGGERGDCHLFHLLFAALLLRLLRLHQRKRQLPFHRIHFVQQNPHRVPDRELTPCALANYLPRILVKHVAVAGQRIDRNQSFHKKILKLDEESEPRGADDEPTELLTHAILHKLCFFPLHKLTLAFGRPPFCFSLPPALAPTPF